MRTMTIYMTQGAADNMIRSACDLKHTITSTRYDSDERRIAHMMIQIADIRKACDVVESEFRRESE